MEYIYAALVLHEADREIDEGNVTSVLEAAGVEVDPARVSALVAALEDVDIEEAIAAPAPTAAGTPAEPSADATEAEADEEEPEAAEEESEEDEEEDEEVSAEGLGDLFG